MTKGRCKHLRIGGPDPKCDLGLSPIAFAKAACLMGENVRDGLFFRLPCDSMEWTLAFLKRTRGYKTPEEIPGEMRHIIAQKGSCDKFTDPTDEEIAASEEADKKKIQQFEKVLPLIKQIKDEHNESWSGVVKCPVCGNDLLILLNCVRSEYEDPTALQKHCHGRCKTEDCVGWME